MSGLTVFQVVDRSRVIGTFTDQVTATCFATTLGARLFRSREIPTLIRDTSPPSESRQVRRLLPATASKRVTAKPASRERLTKTA